jgi:hypothetical protein
MQRADEPAERDDSKETSTAVALLETDLTGQYPNLTCLSSAKNARNPRGYVLHENRELENQEMSSEDYEANGIGDEEEDEDDELEDDDDDESEEHL